MRPKLIDLGMAPEDAARALHMDADELLRYRQRGGLLSQIGGDYSEAWE